MKLNFVIVGTMIEFSVEVPNIEFTVPTKMAYQGDEYEVKLYSNNEYESLFHLYPIKNITEIITKESPESFDEVVDRLRGLPTTPEGWHDIDNCNSTLGTIKSITFVDQSNKDYLQMKLARHIELEEYELAAIVRDKINAL